MTKLPFAIAAIASFALLTVGAYAQSVAPPKNPTTPNNPVCTALCPPPALASGDVNYKVCSDKLAQLPKVTIREVRGVDSSDTVHLVPLCDVVNHSLTAEQTAFLSRGNAAGLLTAIGANRTLDTRLVAGGYRANDVLGILLGPNAAVLYVHKQ